MAKRSEFVLSLKRPIQWIGTGLILCPLAFLAFAPKNNRMIHASSALIQARTIAMAMFTYAKDNGGAYPTGKSSTEIFQKLIDKNYVSDPSIFWVEELKIPRKIKTKSNVLKPENVCFDVTIPVDFNTSDYLPVVFSTGYRINYVAGGNATPLFPASDKRPAGIAVCYHSNSAMYFMNPDRAYGAMPNFVNPQFKPSGTIYQQLTPDGSLAP